MTNRKLWSQSPLGDNLIEKTGDKIIIEKTGDKIIIEKTDDKIIIDKTQDRCNSTTLNLTDSYFHPIFLPPALTLNHGPDLQQKNPNHLPFSEIKECNNCLKVVKWTFNCSLMSLQQMEQPMVGQVWRIFITMTPS